MPPVIIFITGALAAAGIGGTAAAIIGIALTVGLNIGLRLISNALQKKPSISPVSVSEGRTISVSGATEPQRALIGRSRLGGVRIFIHTTGAKNEYLHQVFALPGHEIDEIGQMYLDDEEIPLDGNGNATGKYQDLIHVEKRLGTLDQTAFTGLVTDAPTKWTSAHRGRGVAMVYVRLKFDAEKFNQGFNFSWDCQGALLHDPRDGTIVYSENAALGFNFYSTDVDVGYGDVIKFPITAAMLSDNGMTGFDADACVDGDFTTAAFSTDGVSSGTRIKVDLGAGNEKQFILARLRGATGTDAQFAVEWSDNDSSWTQVATDWVPDAPGADHVRLASLGAHRYWHFLVTNFPSNGPSFTELELYESSMDLDLVSAAANVCDEQVDINTSPVTQEARYALNGPYSTAEEPFALMEQLLSAMAGEAVESSGKTRLYAGAWRAPVLTFTDDDLRGAFKAEFLVSRRDLANTVKGTFFGPQNKWQGGDFPAVSNTDYIAEDGGEIIEHNIDLRFTATASSAQRLANISLEELRRQKRCFYPAKLSGLLAAASNVVQITRSRPEWTAKTFKVTELKLTQDTDSGDVPQLGVDIGLQETDPEIYDWTAPTQEQALASTPPTSTFPPNPMRGDIPSYNLPPNASRNASNNAVVDSVDVDASNATVRAHGPGGPSATWERYEGSSTASVRTLGPYDAAEFTGKAYNTTYYVAYSPDDDTYSIVTDFRTVLPDGYFWVGQTKTNASFGGGGGTSGGGGSGSGGSGGGGYGMLL